MLGITGGLKDRTIEGELEGWTSLSQYEVNMYKAAYRCFKDHNSSHALNGRKPTSSTLGGMANTAPDLESLYVWFEEAEYIQDGKEYWRVGVNFALEEPKLDLGWFPSEEKIEEALKKCDHKANLYIVFRGGGYEATVLEDGTIEQVLVPVVKEDTEKRGTSEKLQNVVAKWYFILRNLSLIVLMLILIYIGIRIVIGSTAGEKAKYKERLMDWLVALCLVMVMHYIMVFAVETVAKITELISNLGGDGVNVQYIPLTEEQLISVKDLNKPDDEGKTVWDEFGGLKGVLLSANTGEDLGKDGDALIWKTNLIGQIRIQAQLEGKGTAEWVAHSFCYVILVAFTLFFAFTYMKRVVYMAFLTMISPLVAMTYPIDKITDGKAQAFNAWLREYIFNLMIQPLHMLLYTVLVLSAYQLASESIIYSIVALGFMMPAEKLMRRFFGFEKAQTPGLLGGAAGAALAMSGLKNILKPRGQHGKPNSNHGGNEKQPNENKIKKYANKNKIDTQDAIYKSYSSGIPGFQDDVMQEEKGKEQGEEIPKTHYLESGKKNADREPFGSHTDGDNPNVDPMADDKKTIKSFKRNKYKSRTRR